jgi:hypothetical protein
MSGTLLLKQNAWWWWLRAYNLLVLAALAFYSLPWLPQDDDPQVHAFDHSTQHATRNTQHATRAVVVEVVHLLTLSLFPFKCLAMSRAMRR